MTSDLHSYATSLKIRAKQCTKFLGLWTVSNFMSADL